MEKENKKVLVIAADGSEEMELVIIVDMLRRAGIEVVIANSQGNPLVLGSRKISIKADSDLKEVENELFDAVVLPGGQIHETLSKDKRVGNILKRHAQENKIIGAICAGPLVLAGHGIGQGSLMTSYPALEGSLTKHGYPYSKERVVVSKNIITSQAPGTAFDFSLELIKSLVGLEKRSEIKKMALVN